MPILERHLNDKSWEYIYIIEENLALITHIAHMGVPSSPFIDSDERVHKMIQDMIKCPERYLSLHGGRVPRIAGRF
jgi:hypothetical protein